MRGRIEWRAKAGRRAVRTGGFAAGMVLVAVLGGCVSAPDVTPTTSRAATPTPSATGTPDPVLQPKASAKVNLPYFDFVNHRVLAKNPKANGRAFIDALVAAGFAKADMQVTGDTTTINLPAGSIQFSVRFNGDCLIGQNGANGVGYHSSVTPLLSTGNCLIGDTRPINW